MNKLLTITCLLSILSFSFYNFSSPAVNSDHLRWEENKPLTWADFKGVPDLSNRLHAYTRVGMKTDFIKANGNEAELLVKGYFEKSNSWVKPDQKTAKLLAHEQTHFDICELYRRKLKKKLGEFTGFNYSNFSEEATRIFNEIFQEFTKEQKRYDTETQHSKLKEQQEVWETQVKKELKKLDAYKGQELTVKVTL